MLCNPLNNKTRTNLTQVVYLEKSQNYYTLTLKQIGNTESAYRGELKFKISAWLWRISKLLRHAKLRSQSKLLQIYIASTSLKQTQKSEQAIADIYCYKASYIDLTKSKFPRIFQVFSFHVSNIEKTNKWTTESILSRAFNSIPPHVKNKHEQAYLFSFSKILRGLLSHAWHIFL